MSKCVCGEPLTEKSQNVTTWYKGKKITVTNVPTFICGNGHMRLTRQTQLMMHKRLEEAYKNKTTEIKV